MMKPIAASIIFGSWLLPRIEAVGAVLTGDAGTRIPACLMFHCILKAMPEVHAFSTE
jgi:hypothetical protein